MQQAAAVASASTVPAVVAPEAVPTAGFKTCRTHGCPRTRSNYLQATCPHRAHQEAVNVGLGGQVAAVGGSHCNRRRSRDMGR